MSIYPPRQDAAIKASAAARRRRKYSRMADELRTAGYVVKGPFCPAHGEHPHAGHKCLDCPRCVTS